MTAADDERGRIADAILQAAENLLDQTKRLPRNKGGRKRRKRFGHQCAVMISLAKQIREGDL